MPKKYKLYGLTGLAYFGLWLIIDLFSQHPPIGDLLINSGWFALYITAVNWLFFERFKSRLLLYPVAIILLTAGLYSWRLLGIRLYFYTPLKSFSAVAGMVYITPHGLLSLLFFGLIKNQYQHIRLKQIVEQFQQEKSAAHNDHLIINIQKKKVKVIFADILYVESQREYVKIVTSGHQYLTKMSTREIAALLPETRFKRVHRSFIVALDKITSYSAEEVWVNNLPVPIGRAYRSYNSFIQ